MNTVTGLPFNRLLNLQSTGDDAHLLRLPVGGQYLNHLGTVHAGALLALAEAGSGEFLLRSLGGAKGVVPVVRRLEAKFRKPANGAVTASASVAEGALDELRAGLAAKGRALISVNVELHDESGAHVLSASVEWFIATAPDGN
jgi:acyl-coenzyme A thioesterase PaaI-like protein